MNLVTGSGYWWSLEELSTLVSKIDCGLFAIENHGNKRVLHYFNAQQNLKRNVFLHLKNNHYEVIDLKRNNGMDFDLVCEITKGTSEKVIQNTIFKHMSQSLRNGFDEKLPEMEKAKYDELLFSEEKQNRYRKDREPSCDNDSRENRSFDKSRNNESKWRIGLKKSRIPKFKPFKESPEKFLILIEWELELNETTKTSWVEAIKYFLDPTDGSFRWYQKHSTEFGNNWRYFCQEFKDNYSLYHSTDQKQKEYYDMNYEFGKNVTFHDYVWKVHRMAKELDPSANFKEILDRIENSVPYNLRNAIMSSKPENEEKLIKLGSRIEKDMVQKMK